MGFSCDRINFDKRKTKENCNLIITKEIEAFKSRCSRRVLSTDQSNNACSLHPDGSPYALIHSPESSIFRCCSENVFRVFTNVVPLVPINMVIIWSTVLKILDFKLITWIIQHILRVLHPRAHTNAKRIIAPDNIFPSWAHNLSHSLTLNHRNLFSDEMHEAIEKSESVHVMFAAFHAGIALN